MRGYPLREQDSIKELLIKLKEAASIPELVEQQVWLRGSAGWVESVDPTACSVSLLQLKTLESRVSSTRASAKRRKDKLEADRCIVIAGGRVLCGA